MFSLLIIYLGSMDLLFSKTIKTYHTYVNVKDVEIKGSIIIRKILPLQIKLLRNKMKISVYSWVDIEFLYPNNRVNFILSLGKTSKKTRPKAY